MPRPKKRNGNGGTAVAERKANLPATKRPMGRGFEETDADSFAIPFLVVLQKNTPWADPDDEQYIKGAKAGMFINTVTLELFEAVSLIPCAFQRRFNRWGPRDAGGGFKGQFMPSVVPDMEKSRMIKQDEDGRWFFCLPDGSIHEKKSDVLTDTRMHYSLQVKEDGALEQVLVSLSRTQVRKSKTWMSLMSQRGGDMWDSVYEAKTVDEENDKGKWKGWVIAPERESEPEERRQAEAFYEQIMAGKVQVKHEQEQERAASGDE
jgi:hypothetical protein